MRAIALALAAAIAFTAASALADNPWPGWKNEDPAAWRQFEANAENPGQLASARIMLAYIADTPADFAALRSLVAAAVQGVKYYDDPEANARAVASQSIDKAKQLCFCRNIFIEEAWAYCQEEPTPYDIVFVTRKAKELNLTAAAIYARCRDYLLSRAVGAGKPNGNDKLAVVAMIRAAADLDEPASVKEDLVKLNRKLSIRLLDDKGWEPVVSQVRTAIDTF